MSKSNISDLTELTGSSLGSQYAVNKEGISYKMDCSKIKSNNIYGIFANLSTFTPTDVSESIPIPVTIASNGITIIDNNNIQVSKSGIYNINFSFEINNRQENYGFYMNIWLNKNGIKIPNSLKRYCSYYKFYQRVFDGNYLEYINDTDIINFGCYAQQGFNIAFQYTYINESIVSPSVLISIFKI